MMETSPVLFWVLVGGGGGVGLILLLVMIFGTFFTVKQQTAAVVQRFGKFVKVSGAGLNLKIPIIDSVAGRVSLRVQQLTVPVETKTKDNVFVNVKVAVQYFVLPEKVKDAFYKLSKPDAQIESYVFDVVRACVPKMKLDDVFEKKDDVADAVKTELSETMDDYGYGIVKALVTDIDPDAKVKDAMNEINEQQRLRVAAEEKGEAERILKVKAAQAEAESKKLQGEGIAEQRKAIIDGLRASMNDLREAMDGATANEAMLLILLTQYFDMLNKLGEESNLNTIMLPHSPSGMSTLMDQLRNVLISSQQVSSPEAVTGLGGNSGQKPAKSDQFGLTSGG